MATTEYQHVVMVPRLAFGHMLPFLALSKKLAANGIRVSSPKNIQKLPAILQDLKNPGEIYSSNLLPSGFQDRIIEQGLVCIGWAPQLEILDHPANGGCLFHSGWGSIIESLFYGHNLILLPMMADQGLNARLLVEKGIGLEVERNEDGSFTRHAIARSIRLVMVDSKGEHLRMKADQMRCIFANQNLHENYIKKICSVHGLLQEKCTFITYRSKRCISYAVGTL